MIDDSKTSLLRPAAPTARAMVVVLLCGLWAGCDADPTPDAGVPDADGVADGRVDARRSLDMGRADAAPLDAAPALDGQAPLDGGPDLDASTDGADGASDGAADAAADSAPDALPDAIVDAIVDLSWDDPAIGMGEQDCAEVDHCIEWQCPIDDCRLSCRRRGTPEAVSEHVALQACADANGCRGEDGYRIYACTVVNCSDERQTCLGPLDPLDCEGVAHCQGRCAADDAHCPEACALAATAEADAQRGAIDACVAAADCPPDAPACAALACAEAFDACYTVSPIPRGEALCGALDGCLDACADDDPACRDGCFAASAPTAFDAHRAIDACRADVAPRCDEGDAACLDGFCVAPIEACRTQGMPMGRSSCGALDACLRACDGDDQPCIDACIVGTSPASLDLRLAALDCIAMQCPPGSPPSCSLLSCEAPLIDCFGEVGVPRGVATCGEFYQCLDFCRPDDTRCRNRCISSASPRAYDLAAEVDSCLTRHQCETAACQEIFCSDEVRACLNQR